MSDRDRGVEIALFILCFTLSLNVLSGMGFDEMVGHDRTVDLGEDVEDKDPIQNPGSIEPKSYDGFMDYASGGLDILLSLQFLVKGTYDILDALGAPQAVAVVVQIVVNVAFALSVASFVRGVKI